MRVGYMSGVRGRLLTPRFSFLRVYLDIPESLKELQDARLPTVLAWSFRSLVVRGQFIFEQV